MRIPPPRHRTECEPSTRFEETLRYPKLTGGFYWVPEPGTDFPTWKVLTCHDLGCDADVGHVDLWLLVLEHLAKSWGMDSNRLKMHLDNDYAGLPRGRVTKPGTRFMILHGMDAPVQNWLPMVVRRFDLDTRFVQVVFDEHETRLRSDVAKLNSTLRFELENQAAEEES